VTGGPAPARQGAAVLGSPIAHSLSPALHLAAYRELGLSGWTYQAVECTEADLRSTLQSLDAAGLAGVSLTMPLKRAVMPLLAGSDNIAKQVGGANTVLFGQGGWYGANTDVPGMVAALVAAGRSPGGGAPWILGAGATAASALAALAALGHRTAVLVARRPEAIGELEPIAAVLGVRITSRPWHEAADAGNAPLVISTTPAGATDALAAGIDTVSGVLFDVVYAPWPTALAAAWQRAGGQVVGGLELLVEQAAIQVQLITGASAPVSEMREAGYAALASRGDT
jgi:shikimate dehydrogenase